MNLASHVFNTLQIHFEMKRINGNEINFYKTFIYSSEMILRIHKSYCLLKLALFAYYALLV